MAPFPFVAFLLAAGCVSPRFKTLTPAHTAEELESRSLTDPALVTFMERNGQGFPGGMPAVWDFERLALAAYYYHPDLELARAQWSVAQAEEQVARSRGNPTVTVEPGYDTTSSGVTPWFPSVSFDVAVVTAGKRRQRRRAAELMSGAARLRVAASAWRVRSRVRASLVDALAAEQLADLLRQQVTTQERIVELLDQRIQSGEVARSEAATQRIALQQLRLERLGAQKQRVTTRAGLAASIGIPMAALDDVKLDPRMLEAAHPDDELTSESVRRAAMLGRSDILAALSAYQAAQAQLRAEVGRRFPDVHLLPAYQYDQGDNKWSVGISFEVPIANQKNGPIAEAQARCRVAAAEFNSLQAHVLSWVSESVELLRVSEASMETLHSLQEIQAGRMASVQAQYDAGGLDPMDLLNARAESLAASRAELEAHVQLQQAIGAVEDAIQRPIDFPEEMFEP